MDRLVDDTDFPAAARTAYLNTASVNLMYRGAADATTQWFADLAEHGTATFDEEAESSVFTGLHEATARLLNSDERDIAVGSSATELLASLAWAVAPARGSNVVGADIVFPSTMYPWARVARSTGAEIRLVHARDTVVDQDELMALIDDDTAVVCVSDVEYSTGQRYDLETLVGVAHDHDALVVVDATQSAGAIPLDVGSSMVDALVAASYKWLCGPFGVAVMYLAPRWQEAFDPGLVGFRSHRAMWDLDAGRLDLPDDATRFEFSTMAYGCAPGLESAIRFLLDIGVERIESYNRALADQLVEGLGALDADVVSPADPAKRTSIVAVRFPGRETAAVAASLLDAGVIVSHRRDLIRFSPHLYNTPGDIARALDVLNSL